MLKEHLYAFGRGKCKSGEGYLLTQAGPCFRNNFARIIKALAALRLFAH